MVDISSYNALGLNLKRKYPNGTEGSISMTLENATASKWNLSVGSAGDFTINNNATAKTAKGFVFEKTGNYQFNGYNNTFSIGDAAPDIATGYGTKVYFQGVNANTDAIWMSKYQNSSKEG